MIAVLKEKEALYVIRRFLLTEGNEEGIFRVLLAVSIPTETVGREKFFVVSGGDGNTKQEKWIANYLWENRVGSLGEWSLGGYKRNGKCLADSDRNKLIYPVVTESGVEHRTEWLVGKELLVFSRLLLIRWLGNPTDVVIAVERLKRSYGVEAVEAVAKRETLFRPLLEVKVIDTAVGDRGRAGKFFGEVGSWYSGRLVSLKRIKKDQRFWYKGNYKYLYEMWCCGYRLLWNTNKEVDNGKYQVGFLVDKHVARDNTTVVKSCRLKPAEWKDSGQVSLKLD